MKFTFENYVSLAKLDKDAKAEDYSSEVDKLNEMDFSELFSNYGSDAIGMRTVVDLKEELKRYDLSTAGRKQDLVDRLSEYFESSKKRKADDAADSEEKKQKVDFEGKNPGNVIGGYKAAAHNPNLPEESREKAEQVLEEMGVDADEKAESTAKLSDGSVGNPGNVAGGFKATLHNPNASDEAKEHAQEMLDKMGVDAEEKAPKKDDDRAKDEGHVIGGYRATLSNPNTSQEAKDNARKALEEMGVDPDERVQTKADYSSTDVDMEGKDKSHVIAGFKATLSNDASSEEAKDHARKVLKEMGVDPEERLQSKPDYSSTEVDLEGKDKSHVIAGFKATLSNDASSKEAKDHARKVLEEMGVDPEERVKTDYSSTEVDLEGKDKSHVIAGFKATLSNDASSEEAKAHALKVLKEMGVDPEDRAVDHRGSEFSGQYTADGKNLGNVVGGYKATLSNPNASEEAKEGARDALAEIQKSQ